MIIYRPATLSDVPQVLDLLKELMRYHGVVPPDQKQLQATVTAILETPSHLLVVADDQGRLVGMCGLLFSHSTWSASPACELQDVLVVHGRRRSHIGRDLIQAAVQIATERGCTRLFLLAESWNLGAHAFYRSLGLAEKTCLYFERDLRDCLP